MEESSFSQPGGKGSVRLRQCSSHPGGSLDSVKPNFRRNYSFAQLGCLIPDEKKAALPSKGLALSQRSNYIAMQQEQYSEFDRCSFPQGQAANPRETVQAQRCRS